MGAAEAVGSLREGEVRIGGVRSPVLQGGPKDAGEAVVFVHGNPGSSRDWEDLLKKVSPFARAVALDMPGFGRADKPARFDYTVDGYARHLGAALAVLIDATVVRAFLVPSLMKLLGRRNWWSPAPLGWLHRRVGPVEGTPARKAE